jgi:hypothetical protein
VSTVFLLFGVITVGLAVAAAFLIVDFPEKSHFLTTEQKAWVIERVQRDRGDAIPDKLTFTTFKRDISDFKIWAFAYLFMTATTGAYACKSTIYLPLSQPQSVRYQAEVKRCSRLLLTSHSSRSRLLHPTLPTPLSTSIRLRSNLHLHPRRILR